MGTQTEHGKAFEYALLNALREKLSKKTAIEVLETAPYLTAKEKYSVVSRNLRLEMDRSADVATDYILDLEPRLLHCSASASDVLTLEIVPDKKGQQGDVRDVLAIRAAQNWEIGISAKNNHHAVKHSRLSGTIDFGKEWLGLGCSRFYFDEILPIFDLLSSIKKNSDGSAKWDEIITDKQETIYTPVLEAFRKELLRLNEAFPDIVPPKLVEYLIGEKDFYKVISGKDRVEVEVFNLHGTLCQSIDSVKPKARLQRMKLPTRLLDIAYKKSSRSTLEITFDEGWALSFRIHNASKRVEPSLKFDINLISTPSSIQRETRFI
ncbi:MAG: HaeIII family restriction endonuclease [Porphyromonas sp.]|nr:HaeIII family restriction endonuclease [Bacteroidales bacterium]MDY3100653.1 HaeIII family restriction endonuclease [Porphyromonas sp.]